MQHALRLAGGAGGVKDEERVFRIHRFRIAGRFDACDFLMIPEIAARSPVHLAAGTAHGENLVDHDILLGRNVDGGIGVFLQRNRLAAAHAFVGRDDESGFAVDDTTGKRFRREAGKDDRVHSADARAGQHRIGRFRDHRQIDRDAVALLHAVLLQHIGEAADILMQFAIGDLLVDIGIVAFPDDGDLITTALQVAVDTVIGNVGNAVLIPFDGYIAVEIGVLDLGERLEPVDAPSVLRPEAVRRSRFPDTSRDRLRCR